MLDTFLWLLPFFGLSIVLGILAGTLGTVIFLRNFSQIVGGLTHFLLGPLAITLYLGYLFRISLNPYLFSGIVAVLVMLCLPLDERGELKHASHMNILWSFGMALGVLFLYSSPNYTSLDFFLFGNMLVLTRMQLYTLIILTCILLLFILIFHTKLRYIGIDDPFLKVKKIHTRFYHKLQIVLVTANVVLLLQTLGVLLLIAIVTLPSTIALLFARSMKGLFFGSILVAVVVLMVSVWISYLMDVPVSSFAAVFSCALFFILVAIQRLIR